MKEVGVRPARKAKAMSRFFPFRGSNKFACSDSGVDSKHSVV
jgi:hypothetical protein